MTNRLPSEPLLRQACLAIRDPYTDLATGDFTSNSSELAAMFGVNARTVIRWHVEGTVPFYAADRAATKLGLNIHELWDDI